MITSRMCHIFLPRTKTLDNCWDPYCYYFIIIIIKIFIGGGGGNSALEVDQSGATILFHEDVPSHSVRPVCGLNTSRYHMLTKF